MANPEHFKKLGEGVVGWNTWRRENPDVVPDLRGANLFQADLHKADLSGVDLSFAHLPFTNFLGANLRKAELRGTHLLFGEGIKGADLSGAQLALARLGPGDPRDANFSEVRLSETVFSDLDLTQVRGLDRCIHEGPSIIDVRTLARSNGLPRSFLQGCGLPDLLIDYLPSILNQPIQFYSCFISYSTADQDFAVHLHADLQRKGVRCWFAPHDMKGGKKLHDQIFDAIRIHDRLLLILSPHSMKSEWVKTEVAQARRKELQQGRQMLFPIGLVGFDAIRDWECFDADAGKDSAREIREYFIPDFSDWTNVDSYKLALDRLVADLSAH